MDSTLVVQVGQCGNAVGSEFWQLVGSELRSRNSKGSRGPGSLGGFVEEVEAGPRGGNPSLRARCVLVDTEPKAVLRAQESKPLLREAPAVCGHSGRGNNWAHGYRQPGEPGGGGEKGEGEGSCLWRALDCVRRSMERSDRTSDLLLLLSLGGGSGSGLGSRMCEELRCQYPAKFIVAGAIAPAHSLTTTPLQHYNTCLAAHCLTTYTDGVMLFQNGNLLELAEKMSSGKQSGPSASSSGKSDRSNPATETARSVNNPSVSYTEMNKYIASCLAGALFPLSISSTSGLANIYSASSPSTGVGVTSRRRGGEATPQEDSYVPSNRIRDVVTTVCPDPALKFVEVRSASLGANPAGAQKGIGSEASALVRKLSSMVPRTDVLDEGRPVTHTSALVVARGISPEVKSMVDGINKLNVYRPVSYLSGVPEQLVYRTQLSGFGATSSPSLTGIANRSNIIGALAFATSRAKVMLNVRAYVHWYERFGCPYEAILDSVNACQDIADGYRYFHAHT